MLSGKLFDLTYAEARHGPVSDLGHEGVEGRPAIRTCLKHIEHIAGHQVALASLPALQIALESFDRLLFGGKFMGELVNLRGVLLEYHLGIGDVHIHGHILVTAGALTFEDLLGHS